VRLGTFTTKLSVLVKAMAVPVPVANGLHDGDDEPIDYSDIEAKFVPFTLACTMRDAHTNYRYRLQLDEGFDNVLVVDGVPIIDKSKMEKLLAKIAKEFSRKGAPIKPDEIFVPWDDATGKSKGYVRNGSSTCAHGADVLFLMKLPLRRVPHARRGHVRPLRDARPPV
jgi:hypothetical protein